MTEIAPDIFAVVAGQFSFGGGDKASSWAIWKADFTSGAVAVGTLKAALQPDFFNDPVTLDTRQ